MPAWIDRQAGKAERLKAKRAELVEAALKHRAERKEREAFRAEQEAAMRTSPRAVTLRPGERKLPDLSDDELALALLNASPSSPRYLAYPHLLILRERGLTRMVWADTGGGDFGVPSYRGDVITEVGEQWLRERGASSPTET